MTQLSDIEAAARAYALAREELAEPVAELNTGIEALRRRYVPLIKRRLAKAAERHAELHALVQAVPQLFARPRTHVFHGVRVGWGKGPGSVSYDDAERVAALVLKHLPEQFEALVKVRRTPIKAAIANLPAADVKRIGCTVEATGDQVVIRPVDGEVDKMVAALLAGAVDEAIEEAAEA